MKTMVNDKASSLCIVLCDQKVTEGMVYTIKYEPKMMLIECTILFLSLGLQALLVIMQHQV